MRDPIGSSKPADRTHAPVRLLGALALGLLLALTLIPTAHAQVVAQPTWTQFQGNAAHAGAAPAGPQPPYRSAWTFSVPPKKDCGMRGPSGLTIPCEGLSAPVVAGDVAIAVGPDAVYGVDIATGNQRWSVPRDGKPSSPALAESGGRVVALYVDGRDASTAALKAIYVRTQKPVWSPVGLKAPASTGVTVDGGTAYVADESGNVYAVDAATGQISWTRALLGQPRGPLAVADGMVFATPQAQGTQQQIAASVVALDAGTGEQVWSFNPRVPTNLASIAAADGPTVVVSFRDGNATDGAIYGLDASDGSKRWSGRLTSLTSPFSAPAAAGGSVYVAGITGGLERIDSATGERVWLFQYNQQELRSSPVVVGDTVLLGLGDGSLGAVDTGSGHLVWRSAATPGLVGAMAVTGGSVVAVKGGANGGLVAFEHDPAGRLIDVESPTVPRYGRIAGTFVVALVVVLLLVLVPLKIVSRRVGPAEIPGDQVSEVEDDA